MIFYTQKYLSVFFIILLPNYLIIRLLIHIIYLTVKDFFSLPNNKNFIDYRLELLILLPNDSAIFISIPSIFIQRFFLVRKVCSNFSSKKSPILGRRILKIYPKAIIGKQEIAERLAKFANNPIPDNTKTVF